MQRELQVWRALRQATKMRMGTGNYRLLAAARREEHSGIDRGTLVVGSEPLETRLNYYRLNAKDYATSNNR